MFLKAMHGHHQSSDVWAIHLQVFRNEQKMEWYCCPPLQSVKAGRRVAATDGTVVLCKA